jgi:hypothetical protein
LEDEPARRRNIELLSEAAQQAPGWDTLGHQLLDLYDQAARLPHREAAVLAEEAGLREAQLSEWVSLGVDADRLVGEDAYLPRDVQQALLAAATRKRLRRPLFALLRALYATGHRARRL